MEPLRYIAGYIAHNLAEHNPELGTKTERLKPIIGAPTWIDVLTKGGLLMPSDSFFLFVRQMEQCFLDYNGPVGIHTCPHIVGNCVAYITSKIDCGGMPAAAIKLFARLRIFIRIRSIAEAARQAIVDKHNKRKARKFVT